MKKRPFDLTSCCVPLETLVVDQELPLGGASYGGDCMVVCNDWHSALVPMLIHAEKTMSGTDFSPE